MKFTRYVDVDTYNTASFIDEPMILQFDIKKYKAIQYDNFYCSKVITSISILGRIMELSINYNFIKISNIKHKFLKACKYNDIETVKTLYRTYRICKSFKEEGLRAAHYGVAHTVILYFTNREYLKELER